MRLSPSRGGWRAPPDSRPQPHVGVHGSGGGAHALHAVAHRTYRHYGGRGIEYRLPLDFGEAARLLLASIGPRPKGYTLDRIDNDGHYEIGNLRWATKSEQNRNRRGLRV